jgi:hypothetical protein
VKPGAAVGRTFSISKVLDVGDEVSGFVQLADTQTRSTDFRYDFYLEVLDPNGDSIYSWKGHYERKNNHEFVFSVSEAGKYIIKITHHSNYSKALYVKILPPGWTSE